MSAIHSYDADTIVDALRQARAALQNVPEIGGEYDQQHSDTHLAAYLAVGDALALIGADEE